MIRRNLSEQDRNKDAENNTRLNEAVHKFFRNYYNSLGDHSRPSIPVLQKQLLEMEDGMFFSTNTISDALSNTGKSAISMNLVIALCKLWQLDISDVFAEVFAGYELQPAYDTIIPGAKYLTNPGYMHKFYGYLYPNNTKDYRVLEFELEISECDGIPRAVMTKRYAPNRTIPVAERFGVFEGVPVVLDTNRLVLMVLTREDGRTCILIFEYRDLAPQGAGLYFRRGVCLTIESNSDKPILTNFVLFRERIGEEKRKYLPGMLALMNDCILVKRDILDRLREDEEMASFFADYEYNWSNSDRSTLTVRFSQILSSIEDQHDPEKNQAEIFRVIRALLRMAEISETPVRLTYGNQNELAEFARYFMQGTEEESQQRR